MLLYKEASSQYARLNFLPVTQRFENLQRSTAPWKDFERECLIGSTASGDEKRWKKQPREHETGENWKSDIGSEQNVYTHSKSV